MTFWELVGSVLASFGGAACIVALTIKFAGNMIAERLSKKYDLQLNKELESIKSTLERKNYISKTRFDTEFQIYRELSKAIFDLIEAASISTYSIMEEYISPEAVKTSRKETYREALKYLGDARYILHQNAPFISKEFFKEYNALLVLCSNQLLKYEAELDILGIDSKFEKENLTLEDFEKAEKEISDKFFALNNSIRKYLFDLEVMQ